jgi:hypothetical protein
MKKLLPIILTIIILMCGCGQVQNKMDVINTVSTTYQNGSIQYITVIANQKEINDCEVFAQEIIQHCIANDFSSLHFSYDESGYPSEIIAEVYLSKKAEEKGNVRFLMSYRPTCENIFAYNIKDDFEIYKISITEN